MLVRVALLVALLVLLSAQSSRSSTRSSSCAILFNSSDFPCQCLVESNVSLHVNCDDIVFRGEVPVLPYRLPLVSFSQKRVGYQSLGTQLFTASQVPLQILDFSQNHLLRLTEKVFEGLEDTLVDLRLDHNLLGDQLNPIFSTNELSRLRQLRFLDLAGNQIKGLEDNIFQGNNILQQLNLENNQLQNVPTTSLRLLSSLQELNLQGNRITFIPSGSFEKLHNLNVLNLSSNFIRSINQTAFGGLNRLETLLLANNHISQIDYDQSLSDLDSLQLLDLSNNLLTQIPTLSTAANLSLLLLASNRIRSIQPDSLLHLTTLNFVDLSRNHLLDISSASATFGRLVNLQEIHLDVNLVRKVDENTFDGLDNLQVLSLDDNMLLAVPTSGLSNLKSLRVLTINHNRISAISAGILRGINSLEELSVRNNLIRQIPDATFSQFSALQVLDLNGNQLSRVDVNAFIGVDQQLVYLDLGSNELQQFDAMPFPALEILILGRNRLSVIRRDTFHKMPNLYDLDLGSNQIESIHEASFANLRRLQTLQLQNNGLLALARGLFEHLDELKVLNLSGNRLKIIEGDCFRQLDKLEILDLSRNNISAMRKNAFSSVTSLKHLDLSDNKMVTFKGDIFAEPTSLATLDLSRNLISYLYPDSLSVHPHLETLSLARNKLSFFPAGIIQQLKRLLAVDLRSNQLESVQDVDFSGLALLRRLDLSDNSVEQMSETAFHNSSQLQFLDLSRNRLTGLSPRQFLGIHRLNLDLSANQLSRLPDNIFNRAHVSHLESIDLSRNRFVEPPLTALQKQYFFLEKLNLAHNQIEQIPPNANILVNIKSLDLSHNPLAPESIRNILTVPKTLRYLNMAATNVVKIPTLEMPFLQRLNLSLNRIQRITPDAFQRTTHLRTLDLSNNRISQLPEPDAWRKIDHLRHLDLSHNPIRSLSSGDFQSLDKLRVLKLDDLSQLFRFEDDSLKDLTQLEVLHMSNYTDMRFLDVKGILQHVPPLRELSLEIKSGSLTDQAHSVYSSRLRRLRVTGRSLHTVATNAMAGIVAPDIRVTIDGTNVSTLLPSVFFSLPMSSKIAVDVPNNQIGYLTPQLINFMDERKNSFRLNGLSSNPLKCDCNARPFRVWMAQRIRLGDASLSELTCSQPQNLKNTPLVQIEAQDLTCDQPSTSTTTTTTKTPPTSERSTDPPDQVIFESNATPNPDSNANKSSSLNTMDSLIIGVIVGVVTFVCIVIVIVCVVKLRRVQQTQRFLTTPVSFEGQCTCMKNHPPMGMTNYPSSHTLSLGGPSAKIQTLSRNGFYSNAPYYVTYPESEYGHR
uniref:LRRCT domain-containing protein n=1 Tax=Strigamia maritima TaxID=126957 RepID=T1J3Q9_STRMM